MSESRTKKKVMEALKSAGVFTYATHNTMMKGVPDVYVCAKSNPAIWIELKYTEDDSKQLAHELKVQQAHFLSEINQRGGLGVMLVEIKGKGFWWKVITEVAPVKKIEGGEYGQLQQFLLFSIPDDIGSDS